MFLFIYKKNIKKQNCMTVQHIQHTSMCKHRHIKNDRNSTIGKSHILICSAFQTAQLETKRESVEATNSILYYEPKSFNASRTGLVPDPLQRWSLSNMFWLVPWASDQWSETPVQTCYPQIPICETKKNTHSQTQVGLNMNSYWQQIFVQIIHKSGPWASVNISGPYNMTQLFKSFMNVQCTLIPSKHMIISYYK